MILTAHQPAYLPWLGYFDKLLRSDIFIFLDTVQFERNSFINRNKIKTPQGSVWLTVPVKLKGHLDVPLSEIAIDSKIAWKKNHLKSIYLNYKKSPDFEKSYSKIEGLYQKDYELISELCWDQLGFWLREMGIEKTIVRSSELPISSKKSDLIIDLCRYFQADHYISGALGQNYLEEERFQEAGITIEYQDYRHPVYPQLWGGFLPYMSIVDFWMNTHEYWLITGESKDDFFQRMG
jgi:hypothetical protein